MHRHTEPCFAFCSLAAALVVSAVSLTNLYPGEEAIPLNDEPQIFVDDQFVDHKEAIVRRAHACTKLPEPVMRSEEDWEQDGDDRRIYVYGTVLRDEDTGQFRLWYNRDRRVHLATSNDGLNWERPRLGVCEFAGSTKNNIVLNLLHSPSLVFNPAASDPDHRYQMLGSGKQSRQGYCAAHSPDGIHWDAYPKNPVLPSSDTCTLAFDARTGEYLAFHKRTHEYRDAKRRLVYLATSGDMQNWSEPELVLAPDEIDDAQVRKEGGRFSQFYNMSVFPYAGQFLGLVTHFRYSGPPARKGPLQSGDDGPVDVQLVYSRDGRKWERCEDRSPVIPLGPNAYDAGCILGVSNGVVTVGDQMWAYYTAITTTHGGFVPEKEITIGRAAWRVDGFVSLDADGENGIVETVSLDPIGSHLTVNVDASHGQFRVAVVNGQGEPIPGFSFDDCTPLASDAVRHEVQWRIGSKLPAERPVRLRFHLDRAKLYSYRVTR